MDYHEGVSGFTGPTQTAFYLLNLDTLSLDGLAGPGDVSAHPELPPDVHVDLVSPASPTVSALVSQCSPPEAPVVRSADSSATISPNRVWSDSTPDTLDAEPVFEVSPVTTGFLLRPRDATVQLQEVSRSSLVGV